MHGRSRCTSPRPPALREHLCVGGFVFEVVSHSECASCVWVLPAWVDVDTESLFALPGTEVQPPVQAAPALDATKSQRLLNSYLQATHCSVFPTTPVVISRIIGVTVGASGAEKRMCQTGHRFLAERSVPLHSRSKLHHVFPAGQAFIFWWTEKQQGY